ncbi:hypothetical protein [Halocatena pleomorpha]|uniref:Uncharacterized protein n=1 Tax=Halocatena pleomorpha TaxID=1785090 RepID=A0A3P3RMD1_9EURY|nr:hypothetical protein [Halocatena pleomorpha]RRJ34038.1 hypothetical protein EIK79_00570 [Halocatena pleomorpha]
MGSLSTESVPEGGGRTEGTLITDFVSINGWLGLWLVALLFVVGSSSILLRNDVLVDAITSAFLATTGTLVTSVLTTVHFRCGLSYPLDLIPVAHHHHYSST